jgi:hypothetical protein
MLRKRLHEGSKIDIPVNIIVPPGKNSIFQENVKKQPKKAKQADGHNILSLKKRIIFKDDHLVYISRENSVDEFSDESWSALKKMATIVKLSTEKAQMALTDERDRLMGRIVLKDYLEQDEFGQEYLMDTCCSSSE